MYQLFCQPIAFLLPILLAVFTLPLRSAAFQEDHRDNDPSSEQCFNAKQVVPGLDELFSIVTDKSLELKKREMPGYWSLFKFFTDKTIDLLKDEYRYSRDIRQLYSHPSDHRGDLVYQRLTVRRIDKDPNSPVYEIWCSHDSSPFWLQVLITDRISTSNSGEDQKALIGKQIEFIGFFYKLHGFYPAKSRPNDKPSVAPLFIGLMKSLEKGTDVEASPKAISVSIRPMAIVLVGCFFILSLLLYVARMLKRQSIDRKGSKVDTSIDLSWIEAIDSDDAEKPSDNMQRIQ